MRGLFIAIHDDGHRAHARPWAKPPTSTERERDRDQSEQCTTDRLRDVEHQQAEDEHDEAHGDNHVADAAGTTT
jgi:hypothetical protein